jgi:hypothetical protein
MSDVTVSVETVEGVRPVELSADLLDDQLIGPLVDRARAGGLHSDPTGQERKRWAMRGKPALTVTPASRWRRGQRRSTSGTPGTS